MHWLLRSFLAIALLMPPIFLAIEVLGWPSSLISGLAGLIAPLFYYYVPALLGRPIPETDLHFRTKVAAGKLWLVGWWWKWLLYCTAVLLQTSVDLAQEVVIWNFGSGGIPQSGFPAVLNPETRQMLIELHESGQSYLSFGVSMLGGAALYLFWRDWRAPQKLPPEGICTRCGYNLTGNISGICPECGAAIASSPSSP